MSVWCYAELGDNASIDTTITQVVDQFHRSVLSTIREHGPSTRAVPGARPVFTARAYRALTRMITVALDGCTLKPRLHDTTRCQCGCQTGLTTGFTTVLNEQLFVQPVVKPGCTTGLTRGLTTGCIVYTNIYPVIKPA